jgi:hypothetical protein
MAPSSALSNMISLSHQDAVLPRAGIALLKRQLSAVNDAMLAEKSGDRATAVQSRTATVKYSEPTEHEASDGIRMRIRKTIALGGALRRSPRQDASPKPDGGAAARKTIARKSLGFE